MLILNIKALLTFILKMLSIRYQSHIFFRVHFIVFIFILAFPLLQYASSIYAFGRLFFQALNLLLLNLLLLQK